MIPSHLNTVVAWSLNVLKGSGVEDLVPNLCCCCRARPMRPQRKLVHWDISLNETLGPQSLLSGHNDVNTFFTTGSCHCLASEPSIPFPPPLTEPVGNSDSKYPTPMCVHVSMSVYMYVKARDQYQVSSSVALRMYVSMYVFNSTCIYEVPG